MKDNPHLGRWIAPGTAEQSGPSPLDYVDADFPYTGAVCLPLPGALLPTYAEMQRVKPFDWHAFLAQPDHTEDEWHLAVNLAGEWVTCACGNQCAALERELCGAPTDEHLYELGCAFGRQILARDLSGATRTLYLIEQRSGILLYALAAEGKEQSNG